VHRLNAQGQQIIAELAQRYAVSSDAVLTLFDAVAAGNGSMAQFSHPDLGGSGQWMQGGMTMVGDMFNYNLKAKVDGLCAELSQLVFRTDLREAPAYPPPAATMGQSLSQPGGFSSSGWPAELGMPSSSGAQNQMRYAYFPATRRLAVDNAGQITVYDTGDHHIGGVSQQQGGDTTLTFTSQFGTVSLASLPVVSGGSAPAAPAFVDQPVYNQNPQPVYNQNPQPVYNQNPQPTFAPNSASGTASADDILGTIERLARLRENGILSEQEFTAKKAELLSRL
jgi:hypothetical protein